MNGHYSQRHRPAVGDLAPATVSLPISSSSSGSSFGQLRLDEAPTLTSRLLVNLVGRDNLSCPQSIFTFVALALGQYILNSYREIDCVLRAS